VKHQVSPGRPQPVYALKAGNLDVSRETLKESMDIDGASTEVEEPPSAEGLEEVFGDRALRAVQYHDMLASRGVEWGLLGPRETGRLWSRHILNSTAVQSLIPADASVVDVGSGAGLPGIPLALARPDLRITLLDSLLRRVRFLEMAVDELGLSDQVCVVRARAEESTGRYDIVLSRAVAPLWRLIDWCEPLMGGALVAIKGESAESEVDEAAETMAQRHLTAQVIQVVDQASNNSSTVVVVTRV